MHRGATRDRIRHGGDNSYGKGADRKIGPSPEGYGPQGGGPRYLLPRPPLRALQLML